LRCKWYVDQSFEKPFFEVMQNTLGFGYIETKTPNKENEQFKSSNPDNAYRFKVDSFKNCYKIQQYFSIYPPKTTKIFVRYIRFTRVLKWVKNNEWSSRIDEIKHLIQLNKKLS
jgi:hypothetical protein